MVILVMVPTCWFSSVSGNVQTGHWNDDFGNSFGDGGGFGDIWWFWRYWW